MIEREFYTIVRDIVKSEPFLRMRAYRHHVKSNVYAHSLRVAYYCYRHAKRHPQRYNCAELVRGALLHDYYLYDWHEMRPGRRLHLFTHPREALSNARRDYPTLTPTQEDIIRHHMFPVLPFPPRTRAGWVVCFYDKLAAMRDYSGKNTRTCRKK